MLKRQLLKKILLFFLTYQFIYCQKIFHMDSGFVGDHLCSLYNAYVYAKKYNLEIHRIGFGGCEMFECYNSIKEIDSNSILQFKKITITHESDIINNLNNPNVVFITNVLSPRLKPDDSTAREAKQLLLPNKNLDLSYLDKEIDNNIFTISIHIRKGNGGVNYDGELKSEQIFHYNKKIVQYIHETNTDPFNHYKTKLSHKNKAIIDNYWTLKFPPEQYYIDQINKVLKKVKEQKVNIRLITDDKNPYELINRLHSHIKYHNASFKYYDNRNKNIPLRVIEDLYLLSKGDVLIRSKSGFAVVGEIMGNFKTIFHPIGYIWQANKLIMTPIIIKGQITH